MSEFVERLEWLMSEHDLNKKMFAEKVHINFTCISHYLLEKRIPTVNSLIKMADYFNCSTDYLLGREEENYSHHFKECPPFCERIVFLKNKFGGKVDAFVAKAKIVRSSYFNWASGKFTPSLDNIICLADNLDCRVDYILGRES